LSQLVAQIGLNEPEKFAHSGEHDRQFNHLS
jgi:hypothetical protein